MTQNITPYFIIILALISGITELQAQIISTPNSIVVMRRTPNQDKAEKLAKSRVYYDLENNQVSLKRFRELDNANSSLSYYIIDSLNTVKMTKTWGEKGTIDLDEFAKILNRQSSLTIDITKPLVIFYHPGPDACSISGNSSKRDIRAWFRHQERQLNRITPTNFLYFYKTDKGLKTKSIMDWHKDVNQYVAKNFFPHHYPCGSMVVIAPDNSFMSYFGEVGGSIITTIFKKVTGKN